MLPCQSWSQCIDEIIPSNAFNGDYVSNIDPVLDSFESTQHQIEQWVMGHVTHDAEELQPPPQVDLVCYGTVSRTSYY
jgi:hypothetical protein